MKVFRIYIRPHNKAPEDAQEFFVQEECERNAVLKVLTSGHVPEEFAAIMVDVIENGTIVQ